MLRRLTLAGTLASGDAERCLGAFQSMAIRRSGSRALLPRIWLLRHNLTACDASYVALAEALE